jgi:hypothetical protein
MYGWITHKLTEQPTEKVIGGEVGRDEKNENNAFIMNHVIVTHLISPLSQMCEYKLKEQPPHLLNQGHRGHKKVQRL